MQSPEIARQTIGELLDARPVGPIQLRVFLLCGAIVLLDGYDLQALALAVPTMARQWSLDSSALAWSLSASVAGLGLASAFVAPFGDRIGRRPVLLGGLLLIGFGSLATVIVEGPLVLSVCRLLTGAGLGICQTNATALAVEWTPRPRRASVMTLLVCQVAVGALIAGFIAPPMLTQWGWPAIFIVGGIGPLLLAALAWRALPESLSLLAANPRHAGRLSAALQRFAPGVDVTRITPDPSGTKVPGAIRSLLSPRYVARTLAYWAIFTFAAFLMYLLISWLPVFLGGAGWSQHAPVSGIVLLQGGGIVGALVMARYIDRGLTIPVLCIAYCLGGCAAIGFGLTSATGAAWSVLLVIVGATFSGGMFGLLSVGALLYPSELRAVGLGTGAAVARGGAVLGPLIGGWVLSRGVAPSAILAWLALPASAAALLIGLLRRSLRPDVSNQHSVNSST